MVELRRVSAVVVSLLFLVLAPGTVAFLVPWLISGWRMETPLRGWMPLRLASVLLVAIGIPVLIDSFARFALHGLGTPAPVFPTRRLVISGFYRLVRNPMYVAVTEVILGQGLLLGNLRVLEYGALVWLAFHLFVMLYEEPTLRAAYGREYEEFCSAVPRWVPRLRPWRGPRTPVPGQKIRS